MPTSILNPTTRPRHQRLSNIVCAQIRAFRNIKITYQQMADQLKISRRKYSIKTDKEKLDSGKLRETKTVSG